MTEIEKMMRETVGKKVRVTDNEGEEYIGVNMVFEEDFDNFDEGEPSILIQLNDEGGICLFESEIKEIEVINE